MKIILPIAGDVYFKNDEYVFPKPLIDVKGKPLIQYVIESLKSIKEITGFVFIVKEELCSKFNLDYTLKLLVENCQIIKINKETKGAVCTLLLAIDEIQKDEEVAILNSDQVFLTDLEKALASFRNLNADSGVITFDSIHPRWSYVLTDEKENRVYQAAEKKPISRNAVAGFYYFKTFLTFCEAAFSSVLTEDMYNDRIYISSVLNQVILQQRNVTHYKIENDKLMSFYSIQKLKEFEIFLNESSHGKI